MTRPACIGMAALLTLGVGTSRAFGWGTLAHCVAAVKAGSSAGPGYHNSPDFFPSKHIGWEGTGVTNEFCWTHEVQRTSTEPMPWHRIMKPTYYSNPSQGVDNSASTHMQLLLAGKLRSDRQTASMQHLRVGWAAHNREDQAGPPLCKAHFALFPAPHTPSEISLWWDHALYERYCDHLVFVQVCWLEYAGTIEAAVAAAFDAQGHGTTLPPPYDVILNAPTGDDGSDGLICLTMKAFRKKQQTVDTISLYYEGMEVKSSVDIAASRAAEVTLSVQDLIQGRLDLNTYTAAVWWALAHPEHLDYWNAAISAAAGD